MLARFVLQYEVYCSGLGCWNCIAREGFEWLENCIAIGEVYCSLGVQWVNYIARRLLYCGWMVEVCITIHCSIL